MFLLIISGISYPQHIIHKETPVSTKIEFFPEFIRLHNITIWKRINLHWFFYLPAGCVAKWRDQHHLNWTYLNILQPNSYHIYYCLPIKMNASSKLHKYQHRTHLCAVEFNQQTVSHKLNVLLHEITVHTNHSYWQCLSQELLFYCNSISNNVLHFFLCGFLHQVLEHQACKITV